MTLHVVTPGETLESIGAHYNLSSEYLQTINQLPNPDHLVVGQSIVILYPQTLHTVRAGETIYSIARRYGVTVIQLLRNNPQLTISPIYPGQSVVVEFERQPYGPIEVNGYAYTNVDLNYLSTVMPFLTYITSFTSGVTEDGSIIPADDERIITLAKTYGVAPLMHLSTLTQDGSFSSELGGKILSDKALQEVLVINILKTLSEKGYYGIDIDFEYIPAENAQDYVDFMTNLTNLLNESGYIVIAALSPKIRADQQGLLYEGHDYAGIGNAANIAFIMTYEWGYTYGPPMPVAPINNVKQVLDYAITEIPPSKIFMGVPTYGYIWTLPFERGVSRATSLSNIEATEIAAEKNAEINYDYNAQSPFYYFTNDEGKDSVVWFEDARSVEAKLKLVKDYNLRGIAYWNLDRPFPQNWMVLNALYNILQI